MGRQDRIESGILIEAGLAAMQQAGKPLSRLPSKGRAMIYALPNGETVRMRTCNDHVLIVVSDNPASDAKLNIEGTDWLLVVMPEKERTHGKIVSYLLPTKEVETEARRAHQQWLANEPNTKGDNRTWALWFKGNEPHIDNYSMKWAKHRLDSAVADRNVVGAKPDSPPSSIKMEVENARRRIAEVAGVPIEAVRITINFEG